MKALGHRIPFTPYTSIPGSLNKDTAIEVNLVNFVEMYIEVLAGGTGELYLLQWIPEANAGVGRWWVYRNPLTINSAKNNGLTQVAWEQTRDSFGYYQLLVPAPFVAGECLVQGVSY